MLAKVKGLILRKKREYRWILFFFLVFLWFFSKTSFSDDIDISVTYGYQNVFKSGKILPIRIDLQNNLDETFTGRASIYSSEGEREDVCEYVKNVTIEPGGSLILRTSINPGAGINQIYLRITDREGKLKGEKRAGFDISGNDSELIIGIISEDYRSLNYLNDLNIYTGLIKTKTVELDPEELPDDWRTLEILDMILINDSVSQLREGNIEVIKEWVRNGGVLLIGEDGKDISKKLCLEDESGYLGRGRVIFSGTDYRDILDEVRDDYSIGRLLEDIMGEGRLSEIAGSASENYLKKYWDIKSLNTDDIRRLPEPFIYAIILGAFTVLSGPGIYWFTKTRRIPELYAPGVLVLTIFTIIGIWALSYGTRAGDETLNFSGIKLIGENDIYEKDYISLGSSDRKDIEITVKPEYNVYPLIRDAAFNREIKNFDKPSETIIDERDLIRISINDPEPFMRRYFELNRRLPKEEEMIEYSLSESGGKISGRIKNKTDFTISDCFIFYYSHILKIGNLSPGEETELDDGNMEVFPFAFSEKLSEEITDDSNRKIFQFFLENMENGFFDDIFFMGFRNDLDPEFLLSEYDTGFIGSEMLLETLNVERGKGYNILSRSLRLISGDYDINCNTKSCDTQTVIEYILGGDTVTGLDIEELGNEVEEEGRIIKPFSGNISFLNVNSGSFDIQDAGTGHISEIELSDYLGEGNILTVKYSPEEEDSVNTEYFLPIITVHEEKITGDTKRGYERFVSDRQEIVAERPGIND